jgi:hypothetical protein
MHGVPDAEPQPQPDAVAEPQPHPDPDSLSQPILNSEPSHDPELDADANAVRERFAILLAQCYELCVPVRECKRVRDAERFSDAVSATDAQRDAEC